MRAGIRTGELVGRGVQEPSRNVGSPATNVLFDERSKSVLSKEFCVADGKKKLLSAYGLQGGDFVRIFKLVIRPGEVNSVSDSCACDVELSTPPVVTHSKEYGECSDTIVMHCAQDELALPGPACYRLELAETAMLGRVYIEMQNLDF